MSEAIQKKFQKLVRQLGRLVRAEADTELCVRKSKSNAKAMADASPWVSAFVDARWFRAGGGFTAKCRIVRPDNTLHGVQISNDMSALLHKVSTLRKTDGSTEWYGLKVTVSTDGTITTDLDDDPNCVVDPTWYQS